MKTAKNLNYNTLSFVQHTQSENTKAFLCPNESIKAQNSLTAILIMKICKPKLGGVVEALAEICYFTVFLQECVIIAIFYFYL